MSTRSSTPLSDHRGAGPSGAIAAGSSSLSTGTSPLPRQAYLGTTRSRTLLFQSYRDSVPRSRVPTSGAYSEDDGGAYFSSSSDLKGKRRQGSYFDSNGDLRHDAEEDVRAGLLNGAADPDGSSYPPAPTHTSIDLSALPPKWVDISDELDKLHAKHLLPAFTDRSKEEQEIENLTTEITREFRKCSRLISSLAQHTKRQQHQSSKTRGPSSTPQLTNRQIVLAQNVQTALATKVQDLSGIFRKKQSVYLQRLKGMEVRGRDLAAASGMLSKNGVLHRDSEIAVREDMELSYQQLKPSGGQPESLLLLEEQELASGKDQEEANIQQRDREVTQIAKSIAELAELFQDLSALVIEQGTMVDRIDFNIENMGKHMHAAVEELNTAQRYQRRTGRVQCILFLILCIALLLAIIIIKPFWRSASRRA
ncbi:t-SNARE [Tilletiaria anomala UBC 951]|uniref:t-SNARE n=1 Tax=Tilletiaria anomala (strain ATCC 24038 / CBS 436.72 / UBC 951) TaxID=1037660 RepID=A0A066WNN3_TILAU|nr:t-SNARE [Tilletiaria anomala UBC 951]KDN52614.1 t-SNARE [Tilletiaria anomala UBC 951]